MTSFALSSLAREDIESITEYLLENSSVDVAASVLAALEDAMDKLADSPSIGHLREDLVGEPLRFWYVKPHLIVYRPGTSPLEIVRVLHASRDIAGLLGD